MYENQCLAGRKTFNGTFSSAFQTVTYPHTGLQPCTSQRACSLLP